MGSYDARVSTWDGKAWKLVTDWMNSDRALVDGLAKASSAQYAAEHKITPRTAADCNG
jgi:branched-chain amino acid transport system substrate-binding protein